MKPWIEKKEGWLRRGEKAEKPAQAVRKVERMFSVAEVAELMAVDPQTVKKWIDAEVIPPAAWMRLPGSGHIRVKEWAVVKLQAGEI